MMKEKFYIDKIMIYNNGQAVTNLNNLVLKFGYNKKKGEINNMSNEVKEENDYMNEEEMADFEKAVEELSKPNNDGIPPLELVP